jgi:hypothetical protein
MNFVLTDSVVSEGAVFLQNLGVFIVSLLLELSQTSFSIRICLSHCINLLQGEDNIWDSKCSENTT